MVHLKLYVTDGPRGESAEANLRRMCGELLGDDYTLDVIDVLARPDEAEAGRIVATPTVVHFDGQSERRVLGDLSNTQRVARALGLTEQKAGTIKGGG